MTRSFVRRDPSARVVATAIGVCSPHGFTAEALAPVLHGPALGQCTLAVDDTALGVALSDYVPVADQRRMDRMTRFGAYAALSCFSASGIVVTDENRGRVGGIFSGTFGPIASTTAFIASGQRGFKHASPLLFPYTVNNACPGLLTILLGIRGVNSTISGANPVLYAMDMLQTGRADALLVGGFEEMTETMVRALREPLAPDPAAAPNPDAIDLISEGAAMLTLETLAHATRRGARPLFEVRGSGQRLSMGRDTGAIGNMDTIDPHAIRSAMSLALDDAGLTAADVPLLLSLARRDSGQQAGEQCAIDRLWANGLPRPAVRHPKPRLGETFGASETLSVIAAYVFDSQRDGPAVPGAVGPRRVMVNGYQLGGTVSSVILEFS